MLRCQDVDDLLLEFLDGGLPAGRAGEVEEHLAGCARCAAARDEVRAVLLLVHREAVPEPPPGTWEGFAHEVRVKIRRAEGTEAAARPASAARRRWDRAFAWLSAAPFPPLAAATAVAVLLAIGVIRMQAPHQRAFDPGRDLALAQDLDILGAVDRPEDLDVIERLPALLAVVRPHA